MTDCKVCQTEEGSEFTIVTVMEWKDKAAWDAVQGSDESNHIMGDIKRFTAGQPILVASKVID